MAQSYYKMKWQPLMVAAMFFFFWSGESQGKDSSWGAIHSLNRFQTLQNFNGEAVLDKETGLIWQQSPSNAGATYSQAQSGCFQRKTGGRMGWRLPTFEELSSLRTVETEIEDDNSAALPTGHPFENIVAVGTYWTSSTFPNSNSARLLSFAKSCSEGNVPGIVCFQGREKDDGSPVPRAWCVRGGPGHVNGD